MAYPKRHLNLTPRGIISDVAPAEVDLDHYTYGENVIFRKRAAGRVLGSRVAYAQNTLVPWHLLNTRIGTTSYWLVFSDEDVHVVETSNVDDITPSGGLTPVVQPWQWSSTLLNNIPVFTNGFDAPHYWDGAVENPCQELPDWPEGTTCKSIVAFRNFLIALDIDGPGGHFENQVKWSTAAEPGTVPDSWTPAADNLAGDAILADTPGPVLCAMPLRGSLLVYKRSGTYAMDFVPDPEQVFVVRTLFSSSGALTRHAVADVNGQHFVVTDGDIILTDGTNRRSIAHGRMREFLFSQLDLDNYENLFVVYHKAKNEVWVCFPESGNTFCTRALVYDVSNDEFGVRDLPEVTCAAVGVVNDESTSEIIDDQDIIIDEDNRLLNQANFSLATESLLTAAGDTITVHDTSDAVSVKAKVARHDLHFGDPARVKFVKRVHIRAEPGSGTLYVRLGARMTTDSTITWGHEVELPEGQQIVNAFAQGRYISIEIRSEDASPWVVTGIDIEAEMRGYH